MTKKKCITCLREKPIAEFCTAGMIGRECASCYDAFVARLTATRVVVPRNPRDGLSIQRRIAREQAAPGACTEAQRAARWAYYGGRCWMCSRPAMVMDHVKPLVRGGSNWPANQRPACWPCNGRKGARWPFVPATR